MTCKLYLFLDAIVLRASGVRLGVRVAVTVMAAMKAPPDQLIRV